MTAKRDWPPVLPPKVVERRINRALKAIQDLRDEHGVLVNEPGALHEHILAQRAKIIRMVKEMRTAVADYMRSEGCDCCRDRDAHAEHKARLAYLLGVPKYPDGSGFDFARYRSKK